MEPADVGSEIGKIAQDVLGYLNFSSGAADPRFLRNVNHLFGAVEGESGAKQPAWKGFGQVLRRTLDDLRGRSEAFRQSDQAEAVLRLVFDAVLPAYRQFHAELLQHQTEEGLFQPFFLGRVFEVVLQRGGPWDQAERIVPATIATLNDYLGHRPVAVLRTQQKIQPYAHEWVRPIPLWIRGAGAAVGRYRELIERALALLEATDQDLLLESMFDPALLDELAVDPRAYDFDHPVNKRPNYLFGQWDLGKLDNAGRCRRFVLQQVSLDAMLERVEHRGSLPCEEALQEAAAVLAGTMLMGSGVSGNRPDAHDSSVTLATLVQQIAIYRDVFYERLLAGMSGPHAERLRAEAAALRQPLGGARQHFNQHLARRRAEQLQRVHLAELFARMGYTEAAARQVRMVPVAAARMKCDMRCRMALAEMEIEGVRGGGGPPPRGPDPTPALRRVTALLDETEGLLHRGIECGAVVDPWNILGFSGQYSLFPAVENSVYDHRVDELIAMVSELFSLGVQVQKEAAAAGNSALQGEVSARLEALADWWDKFATTEVGSIESISGRETRESADHVAAALRAWHEAGTAAGDLAFWRSRAQAFRAPKAYALVVDALLEQHDPVASMALLVQWLSQAEHIPLVEENYSFHDLSIDWMEQLWAEEGEPGRHSRTTEDRWALTRKFLDYLEANAEAYGEVPEFQLAAPDAGQRGGGEEEVDDLFGAAYEGVTFRDSTDDGFEGETFEGDQPSGPATDFELVLEADRIVGRLAFLATQAQLWKLAAVASFDREVGAGQRDAVLAGWLEQSVQNRQRLLELLRGVYRYRIPPPRGTHESLVEFDRRRGVKEMLLEQIIAACVETGDAARIIRVVMDRDPPAAGLDEWEEPAERALRAVLRGDPAGVRKAWRKLIAALGRQPLLYVALARGGHPQRVVASRGLQSMLRRLLGYLPRLGLLPETTRLIATIQEMEMNHPVGPGAITEFDQMFQIACRAIVGCLVAAGDDPAATPANDRGLIGLLEQTVEALLRSWLIHSRGVRLSVLESVSSRGNWQELKRFIEQYGGDLFTQRFMNLGNLRGILHQGVDAWLQALVDEPDAEPEHRLLADLDGRLPREAAVRWLGMALEAVVENYAEYIDYNSTTTQSDRGEMLYTLLDYLRLRASYDRVAWNLQPVVLAHEVLVRSRHEAAAEAWRAAVAERTATIAEEHLKRFARLNRKYGMRLPSIADRLGERFVRPLVVDRLRALVGPAIDEALEPGGPPGASGPAFARLEQGIAEFTRDVSGAGFDVPAWLEALEQEADRVLADGPDEDDELPDPLLFVPQVRLARDELRRLVKIIARE
ncbi:MAG: hypothetical protein ABSF26_03430 [Thermoguttaceae bacterium]